MTGKAATKRYRDKAILHVGIDFNRNTEPELVEKIESQKNRSGYVKDLIRKDLESGKEK